MNNQKLLIVINNSIRKHVFLYSLLLMSLLGYSQTENVGANSGTAGTDNSFFGAYSGQNSTGNENVFIGHSSGKNNTSNGGVFIGKDTGVANTGGENTFVGVYSGITNTSGSRNVFLGARSGINNTTGKYNTFIGFGASHYNAGGNYNTSLGYASSYSNTSGSNNVSIGNKSNYLNTAGSHNTSVGFHSGLNNATGSNNTFLGYRAGFSTLGSGNVFLGHESGRNETGSDKLYIENSDIATPLIYGDFNTDIVNINGHLGIGTLNPIAGLEVRNSNETTGRTLRVVQQNNSISNNAYTFEVNSTAHNTNITSAGAMAVDVNSGRAFTINGLGNVGIGTDTPSSPLYVRSSENRTLTLDFLATTGSYTWQSFKVNNDEQWRIIGRGTTNGNLEFWNNSGYSQLTLSQNSNIGIGTVTPTQKLEVSNGNILATSTVNNRSILIQPGNATIEFNGINSPLQINRFSNSNIALANGGGNVGIGTEIPDEKLTVKGKIHVQEVRVDLEAPIAPDYVFEKYYKGKSKLNPDYKMPTLKEVELYTKANNHLPEVPSAEEMQANGIELKVMNLKLLQKIEELTLYTIEQQKEIDSQNEELKSQKNKNKALENRLDKIEALLNTTKD
ncbi:hypothetical protein [Pontimicrobium sp. MEBiC06410]